MVNRAERDAQDDHMYDIAWRYGDADEVRIKVYDGGRGCWDYILVFGLVISAIVITILVYLWR